MRDDFEIEEVEGSSTLEIDKELEKLLSRQRALVKVFGVGGGKTTRYIYDQGKFIPVWYREFFDLQTTNFTKVRE